MKEPKLVSSVWTPVVRLSSVKFLCHDISYRFPNMHLEYFKLLIFDDIVVSSDFVAWNVVMIVSKYEIVLEYSLG